MARNIILTTMSTLNRMSKNFYYGMIDNQKLYCEGISQLEAGTKYYLSRKEIDEIIVIGSDKVISDEDEKKSKQVIKKFEGRNLVEERMNPQKDGDKSSIEISAYSLYTYGIQCFINDRKEPSPVDYGKNPIDPARKKEIEKLVDDFNVDAKSDNKQIEILQNALKENIQSEYLQEKEKEGYKKIDYVKYFKSLKSADQFIQGLNNDFSLNQREKGRILSKAIDFFHQKTVKDISGLDDRAALMTIRKYYEDIQKLMKELEDNKTQRFNREKEYLKEYIYDKIPEEEKMHCKSYNKKVKIQAIPLKKTRKKAEGKKQEIDHFKKLLSSICKKDEPVNIYLDMQGGVRTDGYVRSAVLSLLNNDDKKNVTLKQVIAIEFDQNNAANEIVDETNRYKISDLVSGMNAFIEYGKANQLERTWNELGIKNNKIKDILQLMKGIDQSLSLCDVDTLTKNMRELYVKLNKRIPTKTSNEEFIRVLCADIKEDYKGIIGDDGEVDILELVNWANNKGFIQQAITLIESKMPGQMVKDGYFSYCQTKKNKREIKKICNKIIEIKKEDYKLEDADHLLVQQAAHPYYAELSGKDPEKCDIELKTYHNDQEILKKYAVIWYRRNNTNHAGDGTWTYDKTQNLIGDFIQLYLELRKEMNDQGDRLISYSLKKEVKALKDQLDLEKENKLSFYFVYEEAYEKVGKNYPNSLKKRFRSYIDSILEDLIQSYPVWKEKEVANNNNNIYFKDLDDLKSKIKEGLYGKGQAHITIPEKYYKKLEKDIEEWICDTKYTVYVIKSKYDEVKCSYECECIGCIDKDGFRKKTHNEYEELPIEEMGLSVKAYNALKRADLLTNLEIAQLTYKELLKIRNIGKKDVDAIQEILEKNGLHLNE